MNLLKNRKYHKKRKPFPKPVLIGYVIHVLDSPEFYCNHIETDRMSIHTYTAEASFAYCFSTELQARIFSFNLRSETEILQIFDLGDSLAVLFELKPTN